MSDHALTTTHLDSEESRACAHEDRRPSYATLTIFFFRLQRSKVFQKQHVHEDVPAAHLAQEDAPAMTRNIDRQDIESIVSPCVYKCLELTIITSPRFTAPHSFYRNHIAYYPARSCAPSHI